MHFLTILESKELKNAVHNADYYSESQEVWVGLQQCGLQIFRYIRGGATGHVTYNMVAMDAP